MQALRKKEVMYEATSGVSLSECIAAAILEAAQERCDVTFEHNDTDYTCRYKSLLDQVKGRRSGVTG